MCSKFSTYSPTEPYLPNSQFNPSHVNSPQLLLLAHWLILLNLGSSYKKLSHPWKTVCKSSFVIFLSKKVQQLISLWEFDCISNHICSCSVLWNGVGRGFYFFLRSKTNFILTRGQEAWLLANMCHLVKHQQLAILTLKQSSFVCHVL